MTDVFRGERLYYGLSGAEDMDDSDLAAALASVEACLASFPPGVVLVISDDLRRVRAISHSSPPASAPSNALPVCLGCINLRASGIKLSPARERLVAELTAQIQTYFAAPSSPALVILLDGPPGTGKTTLAREIAYRVGIETFRPLASLESSYVSDTSKQVASIFEFARSRRAVLIWDDLDRLFTARGSSTDAASRDHRNTLATFFTGVDETSVVIIGTTNAKGILDDAFMNRVKIREAIPEVDAEERKARLRTLSYRQAALSNGDIQEIVDAAPWLSFRDIETFCRKLPAQASLPVPRWVEAWRHSFADRLSVADWSSPQPAELRAKARICDLEVADAGCTVWAAAKNRRVFGGALLAHGQVTQMNQIACDHDVNAVRYERNRDLLLLATDKGLCVVKAARGMRKLGDRQGDVGHARASHGHIWDAQWLTDELIIAAGKDGTISLCRFTGQAVVFGISQLKVKGCRSLRRVGTSERDDFLVVGGDEPGLAVIRVDHRTSTLHEAGQLPRADKATVPHRIATLPHAALSCFIAVPNERGVSVFGWTRAESALVSNISVEDCTDCAFDVAGSRLAIACGDEIRIYSSCIEANRESPHIVNSPAAVTAMSFGRLGQSLVWGTADGQVFSAAAMRE
jgi:hypothetical protein